MPLALTRIRLQPAVLLDHLLLTLLAGKANLRQKSQFLRVPPGSEQSPGSNESIVMYSCFNAVADGGTGIANTGNYQQVTSGSFGGTSVCQALRQYQVSALVESHPPGTLHRGYNQKREYVW